MNQNKGFDNVLNDCLDRILKGETVGQCLKLYPDQAKELEPLLLTAQSARAASQIQPSPQFKAQARYEFQSALQDLNAKKSSRRPFFNWPRQWQSGWAIAIVAVLIVVMGGGGIIVASSSSMPDSPLYSVKLASEQVQLAITPSEIGKTELNARFAERRSEEIAYLASGNNAQEIQIVAQRLNTNLENITRVVSNNSFSNNDDAEMQPMFSKESGGNRQSEAQSNAAPEPASTDQPQPLLGVASMPSESFGPATPADENSTMAAITPAPEPAALPPSVNAAVPAPAARSKAADSSQDTSITSESPTLDKVSTAKQDKLRQIITENFEKRQGHLEQALKKASSENRQAVRQAIARSIAAYEKDLKELDQSINGN